MWFATKTGIDRYDGESFEHYRILNNESVRNVKESNSKQIFAFSERTLFVYNSASDNFEKVVWLGDIAGLNPEAVKNALEAAGLVADMAEVTMRPENAVTLSGEEAAKMQKLLDILEDLDDVQNVFHNAEFED